MPSNYSNRVLVKIIACPILAISLVACDSGSDSPDNNTSNELGNEPNTVTEQGSSPSNAIEIVNDPTAVQHDGSSTAPALPAELLDNGEGAVYSQAVNSALLSGAVVGSGEELNGSLYRSIPLTAENMPTDTEVVHALAYDFGPDTTSMIMHLRNSSNEVRCFIEYAAIEAYDAAGNVIANGVFATGTVEGSLGTKSGGYTDTCAAPGEIVYFNELFNSSFSLDQIASVKLGNFSFTTDGSVADITVSPISYESGVNSVDVLVANQSSLTVQLKSSHLIILTDEGVPISMNVELHDDVVRPGAETVITIPHAFKGSSTNIRVLLDYDPVQ